jgi:tetratricopeptide (TPR) repeat protein
VHKISAGPKLGGRRPGLVDCVQTKTEVGPGSQPCVDQFGARRRSQIKGTSLVQLTSLLCRFRQIPEGPADETSLLREANAARDRRDWGIAAALYNQFLKLAPDNCAIWVQLGHALKEDKDFGLAIEAYKHALMLDANDSDIYVNLGHALKEDKQIGLAIEAYQHALTLNAENFDIYVNLGHALKEDKNVGLAIESYKKALTLEPMNFDIYVNLGHAYKEAGDFASARQAYRKALELNPACDDARRELGRVLLPTLSVPPVAEAVAMGRTIYLDMTDLIEYAQVNNTVSGIQRVVANLILQAKQYQDSAGVKIVPVTCKYELPKIHALDSVVAVSLITALQSGGKSRDELDEALRTLHDTRWVVEPQSGDDFAIAGAFWIYPNYDTVRHMRAKGVRFVLFIHDLIQITHPQFVERAANERFRHALVDAMMLADLVITNSEYVANDVRRYLSSRLNFSVPVKAVPLATELVHQSQSTQPLRRDVLGATSAPFVLSVGTIEVRKNHMFMIRVWEELIAKQIQAIPNLVFVGKIGWDIEPFMSFIAESDHLGGRLHILAGVSDRELRYLYERCLFTMYPSFIEGFGLPLGESLAHGKLCIASNRSSLPEVGGEFAKYVSPEDVEGGVRLVEELLSEPTAIASCEKEIRDRFRPRTWREFASDYYNSIVEQNSLPLCFTNFVCDPGEVYLFGSSAIAERDARKQRLVYCASIVDANWHCAEEWGVWMAKRRAGLQFRTRYRPGDVIAVYLELQLPAGTTPFAVRFSVLSDRKPVDVCYFERERQWFVFEVAVGAADAVDIELMAIGKIGQPEPRQLYLGARRLCCCRADDSLERVRVIEKLTLLTN